MLEEQAVIPPEYRLLAAILYQAVVEALGKGALTAGHRKNHKEALKWITYGDLDKTRLIPYTYAWICQHLDVDAKALRRKILSGKLALATKRYSSNGFESYTKDIFGEVGYYNIYKFHYFR